MAAPADSERVTLKVGWPGDLQQVFVTTKAVLTSQPGPLAAMVSGEVQTEFIREKDGSYSIHRHPNYFYAVLNYLRDGALVVPTHPTDLNAMRQEAVNYNLAGMAQLLDNVNVRPVNKHQEHALGVLRDADAAAQRINARANMLEKQLYSLLEKSPGHLSQDDQGWANSLLAALAELDKHSISLVQTKQATLGELGMLDGLRRMAGKSMAGTMGPLGAVGA